MMIFGYYFVNIKYIKTAFSADCFKISDGQNMVQIMGKIGPKFDQFMCHILPIVFLHSNSIHTSIQGVTVVFVSEKGGVFQFTLPYRE